MLVAALPITHPCWRPHSARSRSPILVCTGSRRSIFSDDHRSADEPSAAKIACSCRA